MPASDADGNLLFGFLALQIDFLSRENLIAAVSVWLQDKSRPLDQILLDRQYLRPDEHELLAALVRVHLARNDGDVQKSLASLSSLGSARKELARFVDPDLQATLAHLLHARPEEDPSLTQDFAGSHPSPSTRAHDAPAAGARFRILRPHAKGGLGEVFVAQDIELNRQVALKEIQSHHVHNRESRSRFVLEAEITGGLEHPGIVPVYGLGQYADGRPFYAMRFIKGDSLKEAVDRFHGSAEWGVRRAESKDADPSELHSALRIPHSAFSSVEFRQLLGRFIDVCQAIEYAHSRGVLHRDLKPGNIMLGKYGETLVVDWGLAKVKGHDESTSSSDETTLQPASASGSAPTMMGQALGTPAYMSPEQAAGRLDELGPASDVYSLGATLYYVLTGHAPFSKLPSPFAGEGPEVRGFDDLATILRRVQSGDFLRPRALSSHVPHPLEAICLKAMSLKPSDRYPAPSALADDVERYLADEPITAHTEPASLRARRWLRKHPKSVAALAATLLVGLASLSAVSTVVSGKNRELAKANTNLSQANSTVVKERNTARTAQLKAESQTALANERLTAVQRSLFNQQLLRASELVDSRPSEAMALLMDEEKCPPELREFTWHYVHGQADYERAVFNGHNARVSALAFSHTGAMLASGDDDGTIILWDLPARRERARLIGQTGPVKCLVFSKDGNVLASGSAPNNGPGELKLWDINARKELANLAGHMTSVLCVAFSPDGRLLASGGGDDSGKPGEIRLWNALNRQETGVLLGHAHRVEAIAISNDGKQVTSGSDSVLTFDATTKTQLWRGGSKDFHSINGVRFSKDGKSILAWGKTRLGSEGAGVLSYPTDIGKAVILGQYQSGSGTQTLGAVTSNGQLHLTLDGSDVSLSTNGVRKVRLSAGGVATCAAFSNDDTTFAVGGARVTIWKTTPVDRWFKADRESTFPGGLGGLDSSWVWLGGRTVPKIGSRLYFYPSKEHDPIILERQPAWAAVSLSGRNLWSCDADGTLCRTVGGKAEMLGNILEMGISDSRFLLELAPDEMKLAGLKGIWHFGLKRKVASFSLELGQFPEQWMLKSCSFSPKGDRCAIGGSAISIVDAETGQLLKTLRNESKPNHRHETFVTVKFITETKLASLSWSAHFQEGGREASVTVDTWPNLISAEETIQIWDVDALEPMTISTEPSFMWLFSGIDSSRDGKTLLTWNAERGRLWDALSGQLRGEFVLDDLPGEEHNSAFFRNFRLALPQFAGIALDRKFPTWGKPPLTTPHLLRTPTAESATRRGPSQEFSSRLLGPGMLSTWSSDRAEIAFVRVPGGSGLLVQNIATNEIRELTSAGKDPVWSPRKNGPVAYVRTEEGEAVHIVDGNGTNERFVGEGGFPSWSEDGKTLYYYSRKLRTLVAQDIDDLASPPRQLKMTASLYPAVSPDGKLVACSEKGEFKVVDIATGRAIRTWPILGWKGAAPGWSPDSRYVGFGGFGNGADEGLWVIDVQTGKVCELAPGSATRPAWSKDGQWISYDDRISPERCEIRTISHAALLHLLGE